MGGSLLICAVGVVSILGGFSLGLFVHDGWLLLLLGGPTLLVGLVLLIGGSRMRLVLTPDEATVYGIIGTSTVPRAAIRGVTDEPALVWIDASGRHRYTPVNALNIRGDGRVRPLPRIVAANTAKIEALRAWARDGEGSADEAPLSSGHLLPGLSADGWQQMSLVALGVFLADLVLLVVIAKAFHPDIPDSVNRLGGIVFLLVMVPAIILLVVSGSMVSRIAARESARGYTTLRFIVTGLEIRDGRGRVIPEGDPRLASSRRLLRPLAALAPAFLVLAGFLWVLRLIIPY